MKKAWLILVLLTLTVGLTAQDLITLTSGEEINCKITKIDTADVFISVKKDGVDINTSIRKSEIRSMQFAVADTQPLNEQNEAVSAPEPAVTQQYTDYSKPKRKIVEGMIYFGCTLPTWTGDVDAYADVLSYSMYLESGMDFGFKPGVRPLPMDVGLGIGINVTSWFTIQAGMELTPKGMMYRGKSSYDDVDYKLQVTYKTNYLEFPIGVMLSTRSRNNPDKTYFYVKGGIAPAFNILAKTKVYIYATNGYDSDSDQDTEDLEGVNKSDFCEYAAIGFGKPGGAVLEIKYEKGTQSVMKADYSDFNFINQSFSLNLLFVF
jgi:hypothetical protein